MVKRISKYYLYYQVGGWGLLLVPMWVIGPGMGRHIMMVIAGLSASHLLRSIIVRYRWLELPVKAALLRLMAGVTLACLVAGFIRRMGVYLLDGTMGRNGILGMIFADVFDYSFLLVPWTMIYYLYHYAERVYRESSKNRKLELRVREMEERSRETGTDMAAMMDSLQRIQASIAEDPVRCRKEITEFSKLLREGYLKTG